jgi:Domain of unknown function (DUF4157)
MSARAFANGHTRRHTRAAESDLVPLAVGTPPALALQNTTPSGHNFGQVVVQPAPVAPQMALRVSEPADSHEREARDVADKVLRMPDTPPDPAASVTSEKSAHTAPGVPAEAAQAIPDSGQPLDAAMRASMEPRFGHDFSHVRVHTDERAAEAAAGFAARAYTLGSDIVFGAGEYTPDTTAGQHLLAHELAHVVQQDGAGGAASGYDVMRQPATATDESDDWLIETIESTASFMEDMALEGLEVITGQSAHTSGTPAKRDKSDKSDVGHKVSPLARAAAPTEADRAEIAQALASITVSTRTETRPMLHPWEIFKMMPQNTVTKKHLYQAMQQAAKTLRDAEAKAADAAGDAKNAKTLETAQKTFNSAVANLTAYVKKYVLGVDPTMAGLRKKGVSLAHAIERLNKKIAKAKNPEALQQQLDAKTAELAQVQEDEKSRQEELAGKIDSMPGETYELKDTTVNYYKITIDGATVSLHDHVDAYATIVASGLEGGAVGPNGQHNPSVADALASDAAVSPSRKKILKMISGMEGEFSTVNTWDRAVLTWGMVQWTGGRKSDLTQALAVIKHASPEAFAARFQKYGLDIDEKTDELVITPPTGAQLRGDAAAKAIQDSPELTAVMSAAGTDAQIQHGETQAAVALEIDHPLKRIIDVDVPDTEDTGTDVSGGKANKPTSHRASIRVGDIFTSEAGVAIIVNQTVHGGFPRVTLHAALEKYVSQKGWHPHDPAWIADAEQELIGHVGAHDSDRAAKLKKALDPAPGSFQ